MKYRIKISPTRNYYTVEFKLPLLPIWIEHIDGSFFPTLRRAHEFITERKMGGNKAQVVWDERIDT